MNVRYPVSTAVINEARLYAQDSIQHTMDYKGWEDQHVKMERITYGKFAQLWVCEFCKLNGIPYKKDQSSPKEADDVDLFIYDKKIDVKSSISDNMIGQVSPGVINKECDEYCFIVTNKQCEFVMPVGFVSHRDYKDNAVFVKKGEQIPGTNQIQRFGYGSYFLPKNSLVLRPFVQTLMKDCLGVKSAKIPFPIALVDSSDITKISTELSNLHKKQQILEDNQQRLIDMFLESQRSATIKKKATATSINRNKELFVDVACSN